MRRKGLLLGMIATGIAALLFLSWFVIEIGDGYGKAVVAFESSHPVRRVLYRPFGPTTPAEEEYLAIAEWDELVRDGEGYRASTPHTPSRYPILVPTTTRRSALTGIVLQYTQVEGIIVAELENGERWLFLPALPDLRTQRELTLRIPADGRLLQGGFATLPLTRDDAPLPPQRGDRR